MASMVRIQATPVNDDDGARLADEVLAVVTKVAADSADRRDAPKPGRSPPRRAPARARGTNSATSSTEPPGGGSRTRRLTPISPKAATDSASVRPRGVTVTSKSEMSRPSSARATRRPSSCSAVSSGRRKKPYQPSACRAARRCAGGLWPPITTGTGFCTGRGCAFTPENETNSPS